MSVSSVESALVAGYKAALPALASDTVTQYPNRKFTPPNAATWAKVTFMPNQPNPTGLGDGGTDYLDGIFQIDLNAKLDSGTQSILGNYEALRAYFHAGRFLTHEGQSVCITSCGRGSGRSDSGYYKIPVTVVFYAHLQRS